MRFNGVLLFLLAKVICHSQLTMQDGWTIPMPSSDSRIIYISTTGNDATGKWYTSLEVGANPELPTLEISAYKTIAKAVSLLRPGYPDWILLKRGDIWSGENFGSIELKGRSVTAPMVLSSYGSSTMRPRIFTGNEVVLNLTGKIATDIMIIGLHFEATLRSNEAEPIAIRAVETPFRNILIEDCFFGKYMAHLNFFDPSFSNHSTRSQLTVRRSVLVDAYTTGSQHASGFFINNVDTILFEENTIDHNGWSETFADAKPTPFRHNTYFQVGNRHLIFRKNIVARAAAIGGSFRCGGIIEDNLFLSNPLNLQFGTFESTIQWPLEFSTGEVTNNVIIGSRSETFDQGRGIIIQRVKNTRIQNNIIANFLNTSDYPSAISMDEIENTQLNYNIIYNWSNNRSSGAAYGAGIAIGVNMLGNNQVDNNDIQLPNKQSYCIIKYGDFNGIKFNSNRYYNANNPSQWFEQGTLDAWKQKSNEQNGIGYKVQYEDSNRDLSTYLSSVKKSGDLKSFLDSCRTMNKSFWNPMNTAHSVNNYMRQGFKENPISPISTQILPPFLIYPNPARNWVNLKFPSTASKISSFDYLGRLIFTEKIKNPIKNIDISSWPPGLYRLKIDYTSNGSVWSSILKGLIVL